MQQHALHQRTQGEQKKQTLDQIKKEEPENPSFLTARPSTRGIFYLSQGKWFRLFPEYKFPWVTIAVRFEDSNDEVVFLSLVYELDTDQTGNCVPVYSSSQEICRSKLLINETAKTRIDLSHAVPVGHKLAACAEFWWEPSQSQFPQLCGRINSDTAVQVGPMDFIRTQPE